LDGPLPKLCPAVALSHQDGRHSAGMLLLKAALIRKYPNEWHDDPIEWKDPNNSANSIVIEILTRGSQEPVIAHLDQSCFQ
jgi:hypothetical protein